METTDLVLRPMRQSTMKDAQICLQRAAFSHHGYGAEISSISGDIGTALHLWWSLRCLHHLGSELAAPEEHWPEKTLLAKMAAHPAVADDLYWVYQAKNSRLEEFRLSPNLAVWFFREITSRAPTFQWVLDQIGLAGTEGLGEFHVERAINQVWPGARPAGVPMRGTPDLVWVAHDRSEATILDYKSSKRTWSSQRLKGNPQPHVYARLVAEEYGVPIDQVKFYFAVHKYELKRPKRGNPHVEFDFQIIPVDTSQARAVVAERTAAALYRLLERPHEAGFVPVLLGNTSAILCSPVYCDYWEICPWVSPDRESGLVPPTVANDPGGQT